MKAWKNLRRQKNRIIVALALVLLVALLLPQITWAARAPIGPQFTCSGLGHGAEVSIAAPGATCHHYMGLLELYRTGALKYHAPGR